MEAQRRVSGRSPAGDAAAAEEGGANAAGDDRRDVAARGGLCRVCGAALPTSRDAQPVVTCQRSLRYATKHGFCVAHLKAESFVLDGVSVRFCQKCSRLQPLSEFSAVNRTCQEKLKAHNARSRERYAAGEGNKKRRIRRGGASGEADGDVGGPGAIMMGGAAALHQALGGWGAGARGMAEPLLAPPDFTAAQLQLLTGSFTSSLLAGWPGAGAAGSADQVMQLLLSHHGSQPPWAAHAAQHAASGAGAAGAQQLAHPYHHTAAGGAAGAAGVPAHALLHPASYAQLPPPAAAPGAWPMSELFAPLGAPSLDDAPAAAAVAPPFGGGVGAPPASS